MMAEMSFEVTLDTPYAESLERVIDALKEEGFGVLSRIDIHDAFKEKLGIEFRNYSILGACNPPLAHKALSNRPDAGLMLPCNVIVEENDDGTLVRIVDPAAMAALRPTETGAIRLTLQPTTAPGAMRVRCLPRQS